MSAGNRKYPYRPAKTPAQQKNSEYAYILVVLAMAGIILGLILNGDPL